MSNQQAKSYRAEFKERAVKLAVDANPSIAQTARDLSVNEHTLHTWLSKYHEGETAPKAVSLLGTSMMNSND